MKLQTNNWNKDLAAKYRSKLDIGDKDE